MHCYECVKTGVDTAAVALCQGCNAGLCLRHLREAASDLGPGGTRIGCSHDTWSAPDTRSAPAVAGRSSGQQSSAPR